MPAVPPTATDAEAAITCARIVEASSAVRVTLPDAVTLLASTCALTCVRMTLVASAPAPLIAMPATPPTAAPSAAAAAVAVMVAVSSASRTTAPAVAVTPLSAFLIAASTWLAMLFRARPTPTAAEIPATPPTEAAIEAAPTVVLIVELSCAARVTLVAEIPVPSPSM